jgi:hypothetical protein
MTVTEKKTDKPVAGKTVDKDKAAKAVKPPASAKTAATKTAAKPDDKDLDKGKAAAKPTAKVAAGDPADKTASKAAGNPAVKPAAATAKPTAAAAKPAATKTAAKSAKAAGAKPADQQIVFDPSADRSAIANQALENQSILLALIDSLSTDGRRVRQFSAAAINVISETDPDALVLYIRQIADALHRPEAQTRWECLEALSRITALDPDSCDDAVVGAEGSLYDEESGAARLAAVRFLCAYGALDAKRSARVWPLIDEAIQCYHGDPEFQDMLISVIGFAGGKLSKEVRSALSSRMDFDAVNGRGPLQRRAKQIIELCSKK